MVGTEALLARDPFHSASGFEIPGTRGDGRESLSVAMADGGP